MPPLLIAILLTFLNILVGALIFSIPLCIFVWIAGVPDLLPFSSIVTLVVLIIGTALILGADS